MYAYSILQMPENNGAEPNGEQQPQQPQQQNGVMVICISVYC